MPQDAFTLRFVARELDGTLAGGKINKINQPEREEVSLLIYTGKRTVKLTLNANASDCGAYFTDGDKENPLTAPNFCMLLRKHLSGAQILGVSLAGFERILVFRLLCASDFSMRERVLYAEIMGKYSNLVLTENGIILGALKTTSLDENYKRIICPGAKYAFPAPQDKTDPSDFPALRETLKGVPETDRAGFLFRSVAGLAPCTAEQIAGAYRGGDFALHVYEYIFSDEVSPCVLVRGGAPADFFARSVRGATPFSTLSEAQSYFYNARREKKSFEAQARKLTSAVGAIKKKQEKRLAQNLEKQRQCQSCETDRVKGELITANLHALTRGMRACELYNYYDEAGGTLKIALDEALTPAQNAQNYYKRYRKQKRTLEVLAPQEQDTRAELDYCESVFSALAAAENTEDLQSVEEELLAAGILKAPKERAKKRKAEIPFRTYEREGIRILAGRNNLQNDRLIRTGAPDDIWLHAQKYHSAHVLIKTEGRSVPESVLLYAAEVCAKFSDGKGDKIPVDYCLLKNVKKPPKAKAGFVIYNEYKTLYVSSESAL